MKIDKRQLLNTVVYARNIREQIISSSFTPKSDFYCIKCGQMRPFGGRPGHPILRQPRGHAFL